MTAPLTLDEWLAADRASGRRAARLRSSAETLRRYVTAGSVDDSGNSVTRITAALGATAARIEAESGR